jgi:gluconokinase
MVIVLMGVAGAGKTTIGRRLSDILQWQFHDADAFHSAANIAKMAQGSALTDDDRRPWLDSLRMALETWIRQNVNVVLACSLLKESYRSIVLSGYESAVRLVYLKASRSILQRRLVGRTGHFAGANLLDSQMAALEEPGVATVLDASQSPEDLVRTIRSALNV